MKNINSKEAGAILFLLMIGNKLLILPSLLYSYGKNDALLLVVSVFIFEFGCLCLFYYANKKRNTKDFYSHSESVFSKFGTLVFAVTFFAYFLCKLLLTLKETENFLNLTIYSELSSELFILPFMLVCIYVVSKGGRTVARTSQIFGGIVFIGIVVTLVMAIPNIKLDGILPLGVANGKEWLAMIKNSAMWFGNYFVLFFMIGKIKNEKGDFKNYLTAYLLSTGLIIALFWTFYSIFGYSSVVHHFAISDITYFTPNLSSLFKLDWFTVLFYGFAVILQVVLYLYIIVKLIENAFRCKVGFWFYFVLSVVFILLYIVLPFGFNEILEFCSQVLGLPALILNIVTVVAVLIMYVGKSNKSQTKKKKLARY